MQDFQVGGEAGQETPEWMEKPTKRSHVAPSWGSLSFQDLGPHSFRLLWYIIPVLFSPGRPFLLPSVSSFIFTCFGI